MPGIPKRIIQIWGGPRAMPLFARASSANARLLNPDFEYMFLDDAKMQQLVQQHYPQYQSVIDSFRFPIQRFDFIRYLAVHQYGGIYMDMDVFLASTLGDLLNHECVFPFEMLSINRFLQDQYGMDWEVGNYAFGAAAGHPFIRAIIENCIRAQRDRQWSDAMMRVIPALFRDEFAVVNTTGPGLVSRTLAEYPAAREQVTVLFPDDVCDVETWRRFGTYGVHIMAGAWRDRRSGMRARLLNRWWAWQDSRVLKRARARGPARSLTFGGRALPSAASGPRSNEPPLSRRERPSNVGSA